MFNLTINLILISLFNGLIFASTSGSNRISTHYYHVDSAVLDKSPVMCGVLGSDMDLSRITAVQDLTQAECGTCLKVTGNGRSVYVMAIDKGGMGLDVNMYSFKELFDEETGRFDASWEATDAGNCAGIIKNGSYELPGLKGLPKPAGPNTKETKPSSSDKKDEPTSSSSTSQKSSSSTENKTEQPTQTSSSQSTESQESSTSTTNSNETKSETEKMLGTPSSIEPSLEIKPTESSNKLSSCNEIGKKCISRTIYTQCLYGITIQFHCDKDKICDDSDGFPKCI